MCLTWLRGKSLLLQEMKSDDCKWAIAVTQGSFTLRGHLYQLTFWCQFLQRKGKKCELWLQHQIILSMYKKITLRVTVNALWTGHAADTKNLQWTIALFKRPWNIFRGAVSSDVLTVCLTSPQIFDDILLTPGLKFKELFLAWSLPSISCGPLFLCSLSQTGRGGQGDS